MAIDPNNPLLNGPRRIDARPVLRVEPRPAEGSEQFTGPVPVSAAEIMAARSPAGGWTRATLARWGVPWPPAKGWKERLIDGQPQEPTSVHIVEAAPAPELPLVTPVRPAGRLPGPNDPDFDSTKHGLLAPPRVTYRKRQE